MQASKYTWVQVGGIQVGPQLFEEARHLVGKVMLEVESQPGGGGVNCMHASSVSRTHAMYFHSYKHKKLVKLTHTQEIATLNSDYPKVSIPSLQQLLARIPARLCRGLVGSAGASDHWKLATSPAAPSCIHTRYEYACMHEHVRSVLRKYTAQGGYGCPPLCSVRTRGRT
jgi:hypothetical protein